MNRLVTLARLSCPAVLLLTVGCAALQSDYESLTTTNPDLSSELLTQQAYLELPETVKQVYVPEGTAVHFVEAEPATPVRLRVCVKKTFSHLGNPDEKQDARDIFPEMGIEFLESPQRLELRTYGSAQKVPDVPTMQTVDLVIEVPKTIGVSRTNVRTTSNAGENWQPVPWSKLAQSDFKQLQAAAVDSPTSARKVRGYSMDSYRRGRN